MWRFPNGLELMTDISAAAWVEECLRWWPASFAARDFVPGEFEAYARIFHRAARIEEDVGTKRWVEVAAERGKVMHPFVHFEALVGGRGPEEIDDWDELVPLEELSVGEATALAGVLDDFTATSDRCWFLLWDGYGHHPWPESIDQVPRVRTWWSRAEPSSPGREYHLIRGSIDAISDFKFGVWWQPANIWWPDDRAWCVASDVDGYETFVGGSSACIQSVLDSSDLEALPIDPDVAFGPLDPLNPVPWGT